MNERAVILLNHLSPLTNHFSPLTPTIPTSGDDDSDNDKAGDDIADPSPAHGAYSGQTRAALSGTPLLPARRLTYVCSSRRKRAGLSLITGGNNTR